MTPGTILSWEKFTFHDGAQADGNKLLVVLNAGGKVPYLMVKTTSQQHYMLEMEGCHSNRGYYFFPENKNKWPKKKTWIILSDPYEFDAKKCLQEHFSGALKIVHQLDEAVLRALVNCFLRTDDCSGHHKKLLGH